MSAPVDQFKAWAPVMILGLCRGSKGSTVGVRWCSMYFVPVGRLKFPGPKWTHCCHPFIAYVLILNLFICDGLKPFRCTISCSTIFRAKIGQYVWVMRGSGSIPILSGHSFCSTFMCYCKFVRCRCWLDLLGVVEVIPGPFDRRRLAWYGQSTETLLQLWMVLWEPARGCKGTLQATHGCIGFRSDWGQPPERAGNVFLNVF